MKKIASELLVERLIDWGVDTVFGLPGDGINGIMEALRRNRDRIRFVLVHHEEAAAFMATGYAKTTGKIGVCLATSGPGGLHLINALYDAKLDHVPVLAITGLQGTQQLGTEYQQEVHLEKVMEDVADYNVVVQIPASIPTLVDLAMRTSLSQRTVSHITIPVDLQEGDPDLIPWEGGLGMARTPDTLPTSVTTVSIPPSTEIDKALEVLGQGQKIVILAGVGALACKAEVLDLAALMGAPIVKTLPGKAVCADDDPHTTGGLGLLGTRPSEDVMEECDTLVMIGTNFPYTRFLPEEARVVQIDSDARRVGARIAVDVGLVGDAGATLREMIPRIERKTDRSFLERAQRAKSEWRDRMRALEDPNRHPIQPQYLTSLIDKLADDDCIFCTDSGTIAVWSARHFNIRGNREFYLSANLASMAVGLPYAIAAQLAHPGRQVVAFVGDGGFAMLMAEFMTACRYGLPIKVVVNNNGVLGQILWEQMSLGYPEMGVRFEKQFDFAPWANSCGGFGLRIDQARDLESGIREALEFDGPALIDAIVNPDEPPMPAKVTYDQAKGFAKSFLHGQGRRAAITSTLLKDKIEELKS